MRIETRPLKQVSEDCEYVTGYRFNGVRLGFVKSIPSGRIIGHFVAHWNNSRGPCLTDFVFDENDRLMEASLQAAVHLFQECIQTQAGREAHPLQAGTHGNSVC